MTMHPIIKIFIGLSAVVFTLGIIFAAMVAENKQDAAKAANAANEAWNKFVAMTNSRATNEAYWHTNAAIVALIKRAATNGLEDIIRRGMAAKEAEDAWNRFVATNQSALSTNNWKMSAGLMMSSWGRLTNTNEVADRESAINFESSGVVLLANSCGHGVTFGAGTVIPANDVPCPCGNTNHWLWKFGKL